MEGRILLIFFLFVGTVVGWALFESGLLYVIAAKVLLFLIVIAAFITHLVIKLWLMVKGVKWWRERRHGT